FVPQHTIATTKAHRDFFLYIFDCFLIKDTETTAYLIVLPETEVFYEIRDDQKPQFLLTCKTENNELKFRNVDFDFKNMSQLRPKSTMRHFQINNGAYLLKVPYQNSDKAQVFTEIESVVNKSSPSHVPTHEETNGKEVFTHHSLEELENILDAAVAAEDYEKAAYIRDEINER
ncbi:MAG: hypothetical protein ACJATX_000494, partial [Candidatus Paceibacteria bacterium]